MLSVTVADVAHKHGTTRWQISCAIGQRVRTAELALARGRLFKVERAMRERD